MANNRKRCAVFIVVTILAILVGSGIAFLANKGSKDQANNEVKNNFTAAIASNGIECAAIGREILLAGGNAVDATLAVMFCEGVACTQSMGLGGGFFMVIYEKATGTVKTINAREIAPSAATENMFVNSSKSSFEGGLSVAVPGELKGYWEVWQKHGHLEWSKLIEPTIKLCREGIIVSNYLARSLVLRRDSIMKEPSLREIFVNPVTNDVWVEGDKMTRPQMARTLEIIAKEGADALYSRTGSLFKDFVRDLQNFGSIITEEDMLSYKVDWSEPVDSTLINNHKMYTLSLPSNGILLSFILNILAKYKDFDESPVNVHRMVESFKYAFAKRSLLGDQDFVPGIEEVVANLTSPAYADYIQSLIDDTKTYNDYEHYGANFSFIEDHGTAHISVITANGDAVSATSTINLILGARIRSQSTGILLNDEMDDFSTPGTINEFGVPASPANYIAPKKRPVSSMCPAIIVNDKGDPVLVLGSAGGTKIVTVVAQTILQILYQNLTLEEAFNRKRLHHQLAPMYIEYEAGLDQNLRTELQKLGHEMKEYSSVGGFAALIAAQKTENGMYAKYDFRRGGSTAFL